MSLVHTADLQGDIEDRTVVDLGCGMGMLALAAALGGPERPIGLALYELAFGTSQGTW